MKEEIRRDEKDGVEATVVVIAWNAGGGVMVGRSG